MRTSRFTFTSFLLRLLFAFVLVFATYNPAQPYSYYYWALQPILEDFTNFDIAKVFVGIILTIGWVIFLRATWHSLGIIGTILAVVFFGTMLWMLVDSGWLDVEGSSTIVWLVLIGLSGVLAAGMSWSHIRRRLTGQFDVDEMDI